MSFNLRLQDPRTEAQTFLELILDASAQADRGGGVFAFATATGVRLLLQDPTFKRFLRNAHFTLIVGVDAVTVPEALEQLRDAEVDYTDFSAFVFYHNRRDMLFHPKLCWFANEHGGRALIGSGNLTLGGLVNNWEAFADVHASGEDVERLVANWDRWFGSATNLLRRVDDPEVLERARRNERTPGRLRHQEVEVEEADRTAEAGTHDDPVLVAEITRGQVRWNQANFPKAIYIQYFQLIPGTFRRVHLLPVQPDGTVSDIEIRQGVDVRSRNFRIELGLGRGKQYPDNGRPIGVFRRIGTRRFRYRLLMPGEREHDAADRLLDERWKGPANQLRRVILPLADLQRATPVIQV